MIDVQDLVYEYPSQRALHGITLAIPAGSITALVGPNGAGKTTLMRLLAALEMPFSGTVRIAGIDTRADPRAVHRAIGYLQDFYGLYDDLTVRQCLLYAARARGFDAPAADAAVRETAALVGLDGRLDQPAGELSRGYRQRLGIGQAIVHAPRLLLLDEPAAGLDPEAREALSRLFLALRERGMSLLVSSHILAELEDYSDEMVIIDGGRLIGRRAVRGQAGQATRIVVALAASRPGLGAALRELTGRDPVAADADGATVVVEGDAAARAALLAGLIAQGFPVASFAAAATSMQDHYLASVRERRGG
ncbi:MAG: ABC transporter ATP-binding protein [Rhodospirillaceae bacterium]